MNTTNQIEISDEEVARIRQAKLYECTKSIDEGEDDGSLRLTEDGAARVIAALLA